MQMITRTESKCQTNAWKNILTEGFQRVDDLLSYLEWPAHAREPFAAEQLFSMRVPQPFASRMAKNDAKDPLLLQVLPQSQEFTQQPGFSTDPLQEQATSLPGLLHKYTSRVLLILSGGCAINCRYCFRRHFPYSQHTISRQQQATWLTYLKEHPEINEVILSGGDPLIVDDNQLNTLITGIAEIKTIKRLRVHTRLPVVIPERINDKLLSWAQSQPKLKTIFVLHINHPNEIDHSVENALSKLREVGVQLLNQSVLLKDINSDAKTLANLSEKLFELNVIPYYLHTLDQTMGTQHFEVAPNKITSLYKALLAELPGFLVPKLVREIPGEKSKLPYGIPTSNPLFASLHN
ncbi:MAG: EF-P beta-lysylation protein EpmB [Pseudomonadota bacterium]